MRVRFTVMTIHCKGISRRRPRRLPLAVPAAAVTAAALAGCGLISTPGTSAVSVKITRDFGGQAIGSLTEGRVPGPHTVLQLLERSFRVKMTGARTVESIGPSSASGGRARWFYYVNGIEATTAAARDAVYPGDRIWWDLHDSTTGSIPAVVGSFPEPFVHGIDGRRLPTVLACASDVTVACTKVAQELRAIGVSVANQALGSGSGTDSLSVLVGTWSDLNRSLAAALIAHGPGTSGVYAKFNGAGSTLELLDPSGRPVRALGAGSGLIAATSENSASPTWLITGTDRSGVSAAAKAFTASRLDNHFGLVVQGNAGFPVPQP